MSDTYDHRCKDSECPYLGQLTRFNSCKCHKTREQLMQAKIKTLEIALWPFAKAGCALAAFEAENSSVSNDWVVGKIDESKSYPSFRIQAGHLRNAKNVSVKSHD